MGSLHIHPEKKNFEGDLTHSVSESTYFLSVKIIFMRGQKYLCRVELHLHTLIDWSYKYCMSEDLQKVVKII